MTTDLKASPGDRFLTLRDVIKLTSLSRATLYKNIKMGRFPRPIPLTPGGRVGWRATEVEAWNESPLDWGRDPFDELPVIVLCPSSREEEI
jgi:prophage regulatory protein